MKHLHHFSQNKRLTDTDQVLLLGFCEMRGAGEVGKSKVRGKLRGGTPQFRRTNAPSPAQYIVW